MIRGYRADIDPRALGYSLSVDHPHPPGAARAAQGRRRRRARRPRSSSADRMTGEDCYVMRAHVRDVEHLEEVIDRFALYGQTTSVDRAVVAGAGRAACRRV